MKEKTKAIMYAIIIISVVVSSSIFSQSFVENIGVSEAGLLNSNYIVYAIILWCLVVASFLLFVKSWRKYELYTKKGIFYKHLFLLLIITLVVSLITVIHKIIMSITFVGEELFETFNGVELILPLGVFFASIYMLFDTQRKTSRKNQTA